MLYSYAIHCQCVIQNNCWYTLVYTRGNGPMHNTVTGINPYPSYLISHRFPCSDIDMTAGGIVGGGGTSLKII